LRKSASALKNLARFKTTLTPPANFPKRFFRKIDEEIWNLRVAVLGEERAAIRGPEDTKRSPVEMFWSAVQQCGSCSGTDKVAVLRGQIFGGDASRTSRR
jgi:hypothetical protein